MSSNKFGTWLRRKIRDSGYVRNQSEFAARIPTSTGTVSMWVNGKRVPDPASCDRIADVLGVDLDLVLWQAGHRPMASPVDPDDPHLLVHGWVDRIDWTKPGRVQLIERIMVGWIGDDQRERV